MRTTLVLAAVSAAACVSDAYPALAAETPPGELAPVQTASAEADDLADLTIEQLADIPVTSASKRAEPLSAAPASLFVITAEDIAKSGALSLPGALRLAPNLDVQQADATQFAISARGFNGLQAGNKLLALIDGRTIYTPLASSIFWNLHQPMLEDIQQIEVISGPGGTLYGPNAVNGVISITTRDAQDTTGTLARATVSSTGSYTLAARHGFALGQQGAVRIYADYMSRNGLAAPAAGFDIDDDYRGFQAGFRADFGGEKDHLTLQGDVLKTDVDTGSGDGAKAHNLLARWAHTLSPKASFQVQAYYDRFERRFNLADDMVETLDGEAQVNLASGRHELVAGAGVRTTDDEFINNLNIFQLVPTSKRLWIYNAFLQDRIALNEQLAVTAGIKVERSTFSGWQLLPNLRLAWQPSKEHLVWAAVSRAVRTPSRIDRQLQALPLLAPAPDFESEKVTAFELGYRGEPARDVTLSVTAFANRYADVRSTEFTGDPFPIKLRNGYRGWTWGVEAWGSAQVTRWWRAGFGLATLKKDLDLPEGRTDLARRNALGNDPKWQIRAHSQFDLAPRLELTLNARAVGRIDMDPEIGGYAEVDGRLAYQASEAIELFVAGRNLLHRTHAEHNDPGAAQLARRGIFAGARLRM